VAMEPLLVSILLALVVVDGGADGGGGGGNVGGVVMVVGRVTLQTLLSVRAGTLNRYPSE